MNTIETIRAEIERRMKELRGQEKDFLEQDCHTLVEDARLRIGDLNQLLSFLDSLEEKPVDFDKAWEEYGRTKGGGAITVNVKVLARHFYELGRSEKPNNHEERVPEIKETGTRGLDEAAEDWILNHKDGEKLYVKDAFKAGAEWAFGQGFVDNEAVVRRYEKLPDDGWERRRHNKDK